MMRRLAGAVLFAALLATIAVRAQEPIAFSPGGDRILTVPAGPAPLSTEQQQGIRLLLLQLENLQLKAQAIQRDFDLTKSALELKLKALSVTGYTFDLDSMTYRPIPEGPK